MIGGNDEEEETGPGGGGEKERAKQRAGEKLNERSGVESHRKQEPGTRPLNTEEYFVGIWEIDC